MKKLLSAILLVIASVVGVANAQQPQTGTAPLSSTNTKYNNGVGTGYWPTTGTGLVLNIAAGTSFCSGTTIHTYAGGTLTLTDNSTNYVFLTSSCALSFNTTGFATGDIPIAMVTTVSGTITAIQDDRTMMVSTPSGGSSGVQYLASTAVTILLGDSRFIRYNPSPYGSGSITCAGSPTFYCTVNSTNPLPSTTYGVTFNSGPSPSCLAVTWYPVVSTVPSTSFTIYAPACGATTGTGVGYWDEKYNIGGFIQQSAFGSHGSVLNLAVGSQTLSSQVSGFNTLYKPTIDACVAANPSSASQNCIVLIHTAAQDYINGATLSPDTTPGTVEYNFAALWTLIHNEGASIYQASTVCSPGLSNVLGNSHATSDCQTVNLWLNTQGPNSEVLTASTAHWDYWEDWDATIRNPEMMDTYGIGPHFMISGTMAVAQKHNQALAAQGSTDIGQWANIWGQTFYGQIGTTDSAHGDSWWIDSEIAAGGPVYVQVQHSSDGSKMVLYNGNIAAFTGNATAATECFAIYSGLNSAPRETACELNAGSEANSGWWDLGTGLHVTSLLGPSTAPSGACATVNGGYGYWELSQDGAATYCNATTHQWTQPFGSGGFVTAVSIATANGFSGSSSGGSNPALTIVAGAITPTSTNGVSAATMAYVDATSSIQGQLNSKAPFASPTFTGVPAAPTASGGTSTTQLATTAFVQAAIAAAGTGAGIVTYSGPSLAFSGTQYFPIGGGATASATETNVDIDSPAAVTIQNMTVQMSVAPGVGNSVVYTWRKNGSSTALTCTISGASATSCSDTTHNFSTVALDLLDIQAVTTGTIAGTPTVVMAAQLGVAAVATVSSFSGDGALYNNSLSTGAVTATLATAGAHKFWGNNTGSTTTPGYQTIGNADIPSSLAPTTLVATGIVDGQAPITITTGASATLGGTYSSGYTYNQEASAATAITYTLPTAVAGKQYCVGNSWNGSAATTGTLEILASASGQFIIFTDGTLSATGGYVISGGAAADAACVVGVDSTHWQLYVTRGTWTKH